MHVGGRNGSTFGNSWESLIIFLPFEVFCLLKYKLLTKTTCSCTSETSHAIHDISSPFTVTDLIVASTCVANTSITRVFRSTMPLYEIILTFPTFLYHLLVQSRPLFESCSISDIVPHLQSADNSSNLPLCCPSISSSVDLCSFSLFILRYLKWEVLFYHYTACY